MLQDICLHRQQLLKWTKKRPLIKYVYIAKVWEVPMNKRKKAGTFKKQHKKKHKIRAQVVALKEKKKLRAEMIIVT